MKSPDGEMVASLPPRLLEADILEMPSARVGGLPETGLPETIDAGMTECYRIFVKLPERQGQ